MKFRVNAFLMWRYIHKFLAVPTDCVKQHAVCLHYIHDHILFLFEILLNFWVFEELDYGINCFFKSVKFLYYMFSFTEQLCKERKMGRGGGGGEGEGEGGKGTVTYTVHVYTIHLYTYMKIHVCRHTSR